MQHVASRRTLEQKRAAHAWNEIEHYSERSGEDKKAFGREAKKLPTRIHTAGLGHALLFLNAKQKGKPGEAVLMATSSWLSQGSGLMSPSGSTATAYDAVQKALLNSTSTTYRRATEEALAYLQWLSRFAEAEFGIAEEE